MTDGTVSGEWYRLEQPAGPVVHIGRALSGHAEAGEGILHDPAPSTTCDGSDRRRGPAAGAVLAPRGLFPPRLIATPAEYAELHCHSNFSFLDGPATRGAGRVRRLRLG